MLAKRLHRYTAFLFIYLFLNNGYIILSHNVLWSPVIASLCEALQYVFTMVRKLNQLLWNKTWSSVHQDINEARAVWKLYSWKLFLLPHSNTYRSFPAQWSCRNSALSSSSFSVNMEASHVYYKDILPLSVKRHNQAERHAQKACQTRGEGRSSGETVHPIYSWDVTGHPRWQGSLDTNGTALTQSACVCECSAQSLATRLL